MPAATASTTNASHPKIAFLRWFALQRPMRAAMLFERFRGDISVQLLRLGMSSGSQPRPVAGMGLAGVFAGGKPHPENAKAAGRTAAYAEGGVWVRRPGRAE